MALPDYQKIEMGTAVIWGQPSASGVTKDLSLNGLAAAAGRMGVYADLGETFDDEYMVYLIIETGTAPTAGGTVALYLACTDDTGRWPATVSGADAAYTVANVVRLGGPVCLLTATNDANTVMRRDPVIWVPKSRYVAPVVINSMSQAIRNEGTATDNDSRVILVPRRLLQQDTA